LKGRAMEKRDQGDACSFGLIFNEDASVFGMNLRCFNVDKIYLFGVAELY